MRVHHSSTLLLLLLLGACSKNIHLCTTHSDLADLVCYRPLGTKRGAPAPQLEVSAIPDGATGCSCPTAQRFNVTNRGGPGTISAFVYQRDPSDPSPKVSIQPLTLAHDQTQALGCTVQPIESTQQCIRNVVTVINGTSYGGVIDEGMKAIVKDTAKADIEGMKPLGDPTKNCAVECKADTNNTKCTQINAVGGKSVGIGQFIAQRMATATPTISIADIVSQTGSPDLPDSQKTNVCKRSDFVFDGTQAYNIGLTSIDKPCHIIASMGGSGTLEIDVPRTIVFEHKVSTPGNFSVRFQRDLATPSLTFSDPTLQAFLGGKVLQVNFAAGKFSLESQSHHCLAVRVY